MSSSQSHMNYETYENDKNRLQQMRREANEVAASIKKKVEEETKKKSTQLQRNILQEMQNIQKAHLEEISSRYGNNIRDVNILYNRRIDENDRKHKSQNYIREIHKKLKLVPSNVQKNNDIENKNEKVLKSSMKAGNRMKSTDSKKGNLVTKRNDTSGKCSVKFSEDILAPDISSGCDSSILNETANREDLVEHYEDEEQKNDLENGIHDRLRKLEQTERMLCNRVNGLPIIVNSAKIGTNPFLDMNSFIRNNEIAAGNDVNKVNKNNVANFTMEYSSTSPEMNDHGAHLRKPGKSHAKRPSDVLRRPSCRLQSAKRALAKELMFDISCSTSSSGTYYGENMRKFDKDKMFEQRISEKISCQTSDADSVGQTIKRLAEYLKPRLHAARGKEGEFIPIPEGGNLTSSVRDVWSSTSGLEDLVSGSHSDNLIQRINREETTPQFRRKKLIPKSYRGNCNCHVRGRSNVDCFDVCCREKAKSVNVIVNVPKVHCKCGKAERVTPQNIANREFSAECMTESSYLSPPSNIYPGQVREHDNLLEDLERGIKKRNSADLKYYVKKLLGMDPETIQNLNISSGSISTGVSFPQKDGGDANSSEDVRKKFLSRVASAMEFYGNCDEFNNLKMKIPRNPRHKSTCRRKRREKHPPSEVTSSSDLSSVITVKKIKSTPENNRKNIETAPSVSEKDIYVNSTSKRNENEEGGREVYSQNDNLGYPTNEATQNVVSKDQAEEHNEESDTQRTNLRLMSEALDNYSPNYISDASNPGDKLDNGKKDFQYPTMQDLIDIGIIAADKVKSKYLEDQYEITSSSETEDRMLELRKIIKSCVPDEKEPNTTLSSLDLPDVGWISATVKKMQLASTLGSTSEDDSSIFVHENGKFRQQFSSGFTPVTQFIPHTESDLSPIINKKGSNGDAI